MKYNKITVDGNTATANIAYALSEIATIYPITPSSTMAEVYEDLSNKNQQNIFGDVPKVVEMQSEAGAAGAMHGALAAGSVATTFTASQGLLLMIPNMYKIAGELLPNVIHVSARTIATHALSIFGDHSDVMSIRGTGYAMLASSSVQECQDLALAAHIATLTSSVPFVHFFDGFRTSHEINTIKSIDIKDIKKIYPYDKLTEFKARALNSKTPHAQGTAQNPDVYFQNREASNKYYDNVANCVEDAFEKIHSITGRRYHTFDYVGAKDATDVIVIMGSGASTVEQTIDYLNAQGKKYGAVIVRLYRPFDTKRFIETLPNSVKRICVLDRVKECGAEGEPLYKDVVCALAEAGKQIQVIGGRYGLSSKEFTPSMVGAVYDNMTCNSPINHFSVGINDDVTHKSLKVTSVIHPNLQKVYACKFYGYGGDGTVSANKNSIKIITETTNNNGQAYFEYDSKKSGNATISHLRFGEGEINSPYLIDDIDFVAIHSETYVTKYNVLKNVKPNGIVLLNTSWEGQTLSKMLPNHLKSYIAKNNLKLYTINAYKIAKEIGLGNKINLIMQAAFFKLIDIIPYDIAKKEMKDFAFKSYGKKGEVILNRNYSAIDTAEENLQQIEIPASWAKLTSCEGCGATGCKYFQEYIDPIQKLEGNDLPVSSFNERGYVPTGTTQYEKRGVATALPKWDSSNCIQCNMCSFMCPHGAIRPRLISLKDCEKAPSTLTPLPASLESKYKFVIQVSPEDCTGCGVCANTCPAKQKALTMLPTMMLKDDTLKNYEFVSHLPLVKSQIFKRDTVKGSQFVAPYFEFSGACAGCGETPYIKVISQLFGERMVIANATGCSSIYGGSSPTIPYTKDENGYGPAWANSLFEDNAEFGYGIKLANASNHTKLVEAVNKLHSFKETKDLSINFDEYDAKTLRVAGEKLVKALNKIETNNEELKQVIDKINTYKNCFVKDSIWIIGGDGWAYDIGYGGLDHVLASGANVNILVLDTEVYSNTGGQASKSTPLGSVAKFASLGKRTNKKDLALMAMQYKNVYVAKVAMGANMNQFINAVNEAEKFDGPSLIIAYAPCINHGIAMSESQIEQKRAVDSGYWHLFRYNPSNKGSVQYPVFSLDSPKPTMKYEDFLAGETRYNSLLKTHPEIAGELFKLASKNAEAKYEEYLNLSKTL